MENVFIQGPAPNGSHVAVDDTVKFPFDVQDIPTTHEIAEHLTGTALAPNHVRVVFHIDDDVQKRRSTNEIGSRHLRVCVLHNPVCQKHILFMYECIIPINKMRNPTCRFLTPTAPYLSRFAEGFYDIIQ